MENELFNLVNSWFVEPHNFQELPAQLFVVATGKVLVDQVGRTFEVSYVSFFVKLPNFVLSLVHLETVLSVD